MRPLFCNRRFGQFGLSPRLDLTQFCVDKMRNLLSTRFGGQIKHYLLDYKNGKHIIGQKEFETMNLLVSDGLISLHVMKEGAEHITRCITMKRTKKPGRTAPAPPAQKIKTQPSNEDDDYAQVDDVQVDGLMPTCLKPAERNKNSRQTVRVSSFYESDAQTFEKRHTFKIHTYFGFPFCDYCSNYLWGLTQQGFQCQDCGMNVHHQCKDEVPYDCKPSKKRISKVFGVDLTTVVKVKDIDNIPPVLHKGISIVEKSGLMTEGIYRVNGSLDEVNRFKDMIDNNASAEVLNKADLFVVCSLLKQYLRELPMPVITYDAYQAFMDANKFEDHEERVGETKKAIRLLPHSHFHTLKALIEHLSRVSASSIHNQMTTDNLSIVFGPTLFRSPDMSPENMMSDLNKQKMAVKFMIDHCWRLLR